MSRFSQHIADSIVKTLTEAPRGIVELKVIQTSDGLAYIASRDHSKLSNEYAGATPIATIEKELVF